MRAEIAGDVGIGNGHAVDEPTNLVAAANVELIMSDVGARNKVKDHGQAIGARGPRRFLNLQAINEARGRNGFGLTVTGGNGHFLLL